MLKNYIIIALRNFKRDKFYSFINLFGLSIGIAVTLLIAVYIIDELSYDKFHSKSDRIYRLATDLKFGNSEAKLTSSHPALSQSLNNEITVVEQSTRLELRKRSIFKYNELVFTEEMLLYADQSFLEMFDFELLAGNRENALEKPNSILLTPELVIKYFGSDSDFSQVLGNNIEINGKLSEITGVIKAAPDNSHIRYPAIVSLNSLSASEDVSWDNINLFTYVLLQENTDINEFVLNVNDLVHSKFNGYEERFVAAGNRIDYFAQPLGEIHLKSHLDGEYEVGGDVYYLYTFGGIAIVVLLLAVVNFMNMSTSRSTKRAKEVGIRKALGSSRKALIGQFMMESLLITSAAMIVALGLAELLRFPLNDLSGKTLSLEILFHPGSLLLIGLFTLILGVLAGSYPSFYLSMFKPVDVLKGQTVSGPSANRIQNSLVTIQFVISLTLISSAIVFQDQMSYLRSKKLGFDKDNLLVVGNIDKVSSYENFRNSILLMNGVTGMGSSYCKPIDDYNGTLFESDLDRGNGQLMNFNAVDEHFLKTITVEFIDGRDFSSDYISDSAAVVINRAAVNRLELDNPVGQNLFAGRTDNPLKIIGVIEDFHFESLRKEVFPAVFVLTSNENFPDKRFGSIRLDGINIQETIAQIEQVWKSINPEIPFDYSFLDEEYDQLYKSEVRVGRVISVLTGIAIIIACIGLFALSSYSAERKRKEYGIRKVLGASALNIFTKFSAGFSKLIVIAIVISLPITYYLMETWLETFAFRTSLNIGILSIGAVLGLLIALVTVSYQSMKVATLNPVETLKDE